MIRIFSQFPEETEKESHPVKGFFLGEKSTFIASYKNLVISILI